MVWDTDIKSLKETKILDEVPNTKKYKADN